MLIKNKPQKLTPSYNPSVFTVLSSNINEDNFKYIMEVYDSNSGIRVFRKPLPALNYGYGIFDVSRILQIKTSADVLPLTTGIQEVENSFWKYDVKFGEQYIYYFDFNTNFSSGGYVGFSSSTNQHYFESGDTVTITQASTGNTAYNGTHTILSASNSNSFVIDVSFGTGSTSVTGTSVHSDTRVTQFSGLTSSTLNYAVNSAVPFVDYISYQYADYNINSGTTGMFLTNMPTNYLVDVDTEAYVLGFSTGSSQVNFIRYDLSNGSSYRRLTSAPSSAATFAIAVGSRNINNTPGMSGVVDSTITSYSAYTENSMSARTSEILTFEVYENCKPYPQYQLIFMDRLGSFVGFNFDLVSDVNVDIKKEEYKKITGGIDSSGNWSYNSYSRGRGVNHVEISKSIKVRSNWINENIGQYLEEMASSSEAYHIDSSGNWLPIIITDKSFTPKLQVVDKLINVDITFEYAFNNAVQGN